MITEFCCNKMHKEAGMAVVVILRCSNEIALFRGKKSKETKAYLAACAIVHGS